ncbi:MAG: MFS transporter [Aestuariivirga sp.]|uniref:MFS transporter n=1 Tax=Aestuariivirga sp. TaxID=2650926 RepID=UPI0025C2F5B3|nr:MFS transporter [Aestuariivirga sp.]MCA3561992.1 MFS transporter [Aestuariivirga sp.]
MPSRNFSLRLSLFNAVLFLGSGIQLPFLPLWLKDRGLPDQQVALVVALMMGVRILGIPLGTFIADLTQRRRAVIVACAFGSTAAYFLLSAMTGFWPILVTGMLAAALLAPIVPLTETLAVEGSAHFGIDYGRIRLWASLSFLTGSLGAGMLLEAIPIGSVILLIACAQALGALASLLLPADKAVRAAARAEPIGLPAFLAVVSAASFLMFMLAAGLGQASHGFLYAFGSVYFESLGLSKPVIGMLWAASVMAEVVMFAFSNRFYKAFGAVRLIMLGTGIATLRWMVTALAPPLGILFLVQTLHAGSFGLTHLGTMHYIRERVPANMRNTAQGMFAVLSSGVLLSGAMWASGALYAGLGGGAFLVMAAISGVAFALALVLKAISPRGPAAAAA